MSATLLPLNQTKSTETTFSRSRDLREASAARTLGRQSRFNVWVTTIHPDSSEELAGEVVCLPTEMVGHTVLIDLDKVARIDSSGLALFVEAVRRISAGGGHPVLIRIHEDFHRVLKNTQLDQVFHICSTREAALAEGIRL